MYSEISRPTENTVSVLVSASQGSRMVTRSNFVFDHTSGKINASFRVSKNAENLVGQQYVCDAMTHAFKLTLFRAGEIQKWYRVDSMDVKGRPMNARVDYARRHGIALQQSHNARMYRRHMILNMFVLQTPTPLHSSSNSSQSEYPSLSPSSSPSPSLSPSADGMTISPVPLTDRNLECSLCMEEPQSVSLFQVTCCIGKAICADCHEKLIEFSNPMIKPACPWCRS